MTACRNAVRSPIKMTLRTARVIAVYSKALSSNRLLVIGTITQSNWLP